MNRVRAKRTYIVTLESGREIDVETWISVYFDPRYGADADGNRGIPMYEIDDAEFELPDDLTPEQKRMTEGVIEMLVSEEDAAKLYDNEMVEIADEEAERY